MYALIGIVVVIGAVLGGYLMGHGNLAVIFQPAEIVIIFGASLGSFLVFNKIFGGILTSRLIFFVLLLRRSLNDNKRKKDSPYSRSCHLQNKLPPGPGGVEQGQRAHRIRSALLLVAH